MRIGYFVHDLNDSAVLKRVRMFRAAGADVVLFGFRRTAEQLDEVDGQPATDLGRTFDGRFVQRAVKVALTSLAARRLRPKVDTVDVIVGRNIEMLAVAASARAFSGSKAPLVYECLDIHRLMMSSKPPGRLLRSLERRLLGLSSLLIVSSPAYLSAHFARQNACVPTLLLENKVLDLTSEPETRRRPRPTPPWRIGWFGVIRCNRSLRLLADLARNNPGRVEVLIRGRVAEGEFEGFRKVVEETEGLVFGGPYSPDELDALYASVHFTWAIDYFEEGLNSTWLLPNRIYEGGLHGSVAIALASVETGRWLRARGLGVLLTEPERELQPFMQSLTEAEYRRLQEAALAVPRSDFAMDRNACVKLVETLGRMGNGT